MSPLEAYGWFTTLLGLILVAITLVGWRIGR